MQRFINLFVFIFIIAMGITQNAQADIFLKQKFHTDAMTIMGQTQPAEDMISKIWITQKGIRNDSPDESMIMLLGEKKIIILNHLDKTYMVLPMDMDQMMEESASGQSPEENAAMQGMMQNMVKKDISVSATGETKTIRKWNCRKYRVTMDTMMGQIVNEVWATEDLKVDQKLYERLNTAMMTSMPGMQQSVQDIQEEMKKIKGVQVKTVSSQQIMGKTRTSTTELLDYKEGDAPADLFDIPKGYQEKRR